MKAKLEAELQALIDHRPVVAAEINERREEGDLKENAGYDAAREMQDQEEARIKQISELLANSTTEREGVVEGVALVGSVVHVYYNGDENEKETFLIGTRAAATGNEHLETYSEHSLDEGSTSRAASYVGLVWGDNTVTWGAGTDTDIIVAGIKALVSAINNK